MPNGNNFCSVNLLREGPFGESEPLGLRIGRNNRCKRFRLLYGGISSIQKFSGAKAMVGSVCLMVEAYPDADFTSKGADLARRYGRNLRSSLEHARRKTDSRASNR